MVNYIYSLTTIPKKFDNLYLTIDSLLNQTIKATKIIINIPKQYSLRFNSSIEKDKIDKFIEKYSNNEVIINLLNNDYGPGTKLLGLFENNIINFDMENTYIILVDDDNIYKEDMIENFINNNKTNNCEVGSYHCYPLMDIMIGQGADGYFIKLNQINEFEKYYNVIKNYDYINYHDDFYISYFFHLKKVNMNFIQYKSKIWESHNNIEPLCNMKGKYERHNLQKNVYFILRGLNDEGKFNFLTNF